MNLCESPPSITRDSFLLRWYIFTMWLNLPYGWKSVEKCVRRQGSDKLCRFRFQLYKPCLFDASTKFTLHHSEPVFCTYLRPTTLKIPLALFCLFLVTDCGKKRAGTSSPWRGACEMRFTRPVKRIWNPSTDLGDRVTLCDTDPRSLFCFGQKDTD